MVANQFRIEIFGINVPDEIEYKTDIAELVVRAASEQIGGLKENDIVVITSKIISKAESKLIKIADIKPSKKAYRLGKIYKTDPRVMELYLRQGPIRAVIPIKKIAQKLNFFEKCSIDKKKMQQVIDENAYMFMIDVGGQLMSWGGLDFSNAPPGFCTVPPEDPDKSAKEIRRRINELTGIDVAVVITDTEWKLDKFGSVDVAIGSSGILPITKKFASGDRYGKPKFGGIDDITNLVSAAANLVFGQTAENVPIAIIRGLKYEKSEQGVKEFLFDLRIIRYGLVSSILETIKFRILEKIL